MPQPAQHIERYLPELSTVATENYSRRTEEIARDWTQMLSRSAFLKVKYGLIDAKGVLDALSHLRTDWDSYGAQPPSTLAITATRGILEQLCSSLILPTTIVPSATGGVSVYFVSGERSAYVENYNDGTQALVMYDRNGATEVLEIGTEISCEDIGARISTYLG